MRKKGAILNLDKVAKMVLYPGKEAGVKRSIFVPFAALSSATWTT